MTKWILILFVLISGCSTGPKITRPVDQPLYPNGRYNHQVDLEILGAQSRQMRMRGVVLLSESQIRVTGLSPFNTTLFRIVDEKGKELRVEVYEDRMKPFVDQLEKKYVVLKKVFRFPQNKLKDFADEDGQMVQIQFGEFDRQGIARMVRLSSAKFNLKIKVSDYELAKVL